MKSSCMSSQQADINEAVRSMELFSLCFSSVYYHSMSTNIIQHFMLICKPGNPFSLVFYSFGKHPTKLLLQLPVGKLCMSDR